MILAFIGVVFLIFAVLTSSVTLILQENRSHNINWEAPLPEAGGYIEETKTDREERLMKETESERYDKRRSEESETATAPPVQEEARKSDILVMTDMLRRAGDNAETLAKFVSGEFTGFSIGGSNAVFEEVPDA